MNSKVYLRFRPLIVNMAHVRKKLGVYQIQPKSGLLWEIHYGIRIPDKNKIH